MIRQVASLPFRVSALFVVALAGRVGAEDSSAPSSAGEPGFRLNFEGHYGPATAAAQQIHAEAAYLRAYGEMQKDLAEARIRHAEARRLEGANEVQAVRDHILKRDLIEADRDKRIGKKLADRRKLNERVLERLKNHPELNAGEIVTGVALNFLKNRLSPTFITFRAASMGSQEAAKEVAAQLHLTPDTIHGLQVKQTLARGESHVFRLDEGMALQVDWWPPALRTAELRSSREKFKQARDAVLDESTTRSEEQRLDAIAKLILAHTALEEAFLRGQTRTVRIKSANAFTAYQEGKAFLQSLGAEVRRLERLGPGGASPEGLAYRGNELPDMLAHMVRNGLEFAPAKPGDEPPYQRVFHMLRDLYVAVETDADVPEAPTRAVIPDEPKRFPLGDPAK